MNAPVSIIYATQTGTSQVLAELLSYELAARNIDHRSFNASEYPISNLIDEQRCVFIVSTAGDGEFPSRAAGFWRHLLNSNLPAGILENVRISIFGLGNSTYSKFNHAALKLSKRLMFLGCSQILPICLYDEQTDDCYPLFYKWIDIFVEQEFGRVLVVQNIRSKFQMVWDTPPSQVPLFSNLHEAKVVEMARITDPTHFQCVFNVRIGTNYAAYSPGDILKVYAENDDADISTIIHLFRWEKFSNRHVSITRVRADYPEFTDKIQGVEFRSLLKTGFVISNHTPTQLFFHFLHVHLDRSKTWRMKRLYLDKIYELGNVRDPDSVSDYESYCWRPKRRLVEVLQEFFHPTNFETLGDPTDELLDPECVFDLFEWNRPRSFSISSADASNGVLDLTVGIVEYKTIHLPTSRVGVVSSHFKHLWNHAINRNRLHVGFEKGSLTYHPNKSLLLLCSGTGISPMLSLIQHKLKVAKDQGKVWLFFGCRYIDKDFLYRQTLKEYAKTHPCIEIFAAGSRDNKEAVINALGERTQHRDGSMKHYLQDMMLGRRDLIQTLLGDSDTVVYLSGNRHLPKAVSQVLAEVSQNPHMVSHLQRHHRYYTETW